MAQSSLLILYIVISTVEGQTSPVFDCTRAVQACPAGAICSAPSMICVTCPAGKYGYACSLNGSRLENQNECAVHCSNGGTCLSDNNTCSCHPDYTGTFCDVPIIGLDCGATTPDRGSVMTIDISKVVGIGSATPQIIVEGADPDNSYDDVCFGASGVTSLGVKNDYKYDKMTRECEMAEIKYVDSKTTYTRKFIVRFQFGQTSRTDFRVTAVCGPSNSTVTVIAYSPEILHGGDAVKWLKNLDVSRTVAGARISVGLNVGGDPLDPKTSYSLTQTIDVTLTLDISSGEFKAILLEEFKIDNRANTPTYLLLMTGGCPTEHERTVVKTSATRDANTRHIITLQTVPIIMDGTSKNRYTFVVKVCRSGHEAECNDVACSARRRKRSGGDDIAMLDVGFSINDQVQQSRSDNSQNIEVLNQNECAVSTEVMASFVTMGVVILLLLVLIMILIIRTRRSPRRDVTTYQQRHVDTASTISRQKMDLGAYLDIKT